MKNKGLLYVLMAVLLVIVVGESTYLAMNSNKFKQNSNSLQDGNVDNNKEDETCDCTTSASENLSNQFGYLGYTTEDNSIVEKYAVYINGKTKAFDIKFVKNEENLGTFVDYEIVGSINNVPMMRLYNKNVEFNATSINSAINKNTFSFIKGTDGKDYILFMAAYEEEDEGNVRRGYNLYVLNDSLEVISKDIYYDLEKYNHFKVASSLIQLEDMSIYYENNFEACTGWSDSYTPVKLVDNTIYYLQIGSGEAKEYAYTVGDNKLSYNLVRTIELNY